jgi:hypothetical protein
MRLKPAHFLNIIGGMIMKFAGWYGIVVGILMLCQWGFFLGAGQVPELQTEPYRIAFHLAGEFLTAVLLVVSGFGLLRGKGWAASLFLVAAGMVIYSEIVSPGYFAQSGQWVLVGMFAVLFIFALVSVSRLVNSQVTK